MHDDPLGVDDEPISWADDMDGDPLSDDMI